MKHRVRRPLLPVLILLPVVALLAVGCGGEEVDVLRTSTDVTTGPEDAVGPDAGCMVTVDGVSRYRVARGDTLIAIARKVYGDGALWREIALANPTTVTADGLTRAGVLLTIPFDGR